MRCPTLDELPVPPSGRVGWPWTAESLQLPDTIRDGKPWPRVSVVTPSYNQAEFVEETIRSVLLQGYPDLEYIIIDGGSTDGSIEIIRKYEPWLASWVSEPDRGQTHAINKGWERATGDVLAYLNSDDCYLCGAIATAAQAFCANPNVGMVYGSAIVVDEVGRELRMWEAKPFDLKTMLTVGNSVPQPATFFSGRALKCAGYLNEIWHMIMDYELSIRLGLRFATARVPRTLARFRDHAQSKTRSRFEATAMELLQFVSTFFADQVSSQDLQAIKRATASRVHYEWAMAYLVQRQSEKHKAFEQLCDSIQLDAQFALRRPLQTAYLMKEVILGYLQAVASRSRVSLKRTH